MKSDVYVFLSEKRITGVACSPFWNLYSKISKNIRRTDIYNKYRNKKWADKKQVSYPWSELVEQT
ncbi:MAG: hypothetical protein LBC03_01575 [Nitrososphaerota archaeon]|nr:hypothetical protein [Nitrososphaerota archaeon]